MVMKSEKIIMQPTKKLKKELERLRNKEKKTPFDYMLRNEIISELRDRKGLEYKAP